MEGKPIGFSSDALSILSNAKSAMVQQEIELLEIVTGRPSPNKYGVFITTNTNDVYYLFRIREFSDLCQQQCNW